jgi:hypothetical protein
VRPTMAARSTVSLLVFVVAASASVDVDDVALIALFFWKEDFLRKARRTSTVEIMDANEAFAAKVLHAVMMPRAWVKARACCEED